MTARAGSEVEAANVALGHLRQPPIATLDDNNDRARAVKAMFATARDTMLVRQYWNFATGWARPAAAVGFVHPSDLKTAYPLPGDCLKVRFIEHAGQSAWEVGTAKADPSGSTAEVPVLLTNITAPLICYTRCIQDVRLWDPEFTLADSYMLASLAGPQMGASVERIKFCKGMADSYEDDAAENDAREKSKQEVTRFTSWTASRRRGGSVIR